MPVTIVVGGQYGSEGKGKVVALLAEEVSIPWLVRCGGPNSGHTVTIDGLNVVLRQIPCCAQPDTAVFCVSAGCVVDEDVLLSEVDLLKIDRDRIIVDPRAVLLTEEDRRAEHDMLQGIASTCSGNGAALVRRMSRQAGVLLAGDSVRLRARCSVYSVAPLLHYQWECGAHIIVEGTQGFALSLLHGQDYPFVTSRDTTAAGFAMEVGLSPRAVDKIVMVVRTFPIRVGGPSGPLPEEISWEDIQRESGAPGVFPEYTSVTLRLRRVARFDMKAVERACRYNQPTSLAVMGLDRIDHANRGATEFNGLSEQGRKFLHELVCCTEVPVNLVGTGFSSSQAIRLRGTEG